MDKNKNKKVKSKTKKLLDKLESQFGNAGFFLINYFYYYSKYESKEEWYSEKESTRAQSEKW